MVVFAAYPLSETRVQREAEVLIRNGYDVDVICLRLLGEKAVDQYKGVRIFREKLRCSRLMRKGSLIRQFFSYMMFLVQASLRLSYLHMKYRYNIIQVHNLPDFLVFCALIPKLMGVPIILDLHDLMPEFFAGRFGKENSVGLRLVRFQELLACKFASHVITVSEHWRQALIRRGVPPQKCSVVMNVADDKIFNFTANYRSQSRQDGEFRLIYHGAMPERYGLDLAVLGIDRVREDIPGIRLKLIGRGEHLPRLIEMVEELGLGQYVSFEDLYLAEELPEIIRSCDLGIVPYRNDVFTDGLVPTKLMEYAALGIPAIAARTTAIQEYFSDANVEFFEPGNVDDLARCMRDLYQNPAHLVKLARGSKKFNQRYNWSRIGEDYVSLVDRIRLHNPIVSA